MYRDENIKIKKLKEYSQSISTIVQILPLISIQKFFKVFFPDFLFLSVELVLLKGTKCDISARCRESYFFANSLSMILQSTNSKIFSFINLAKLFFLNKAKIHFVYINFNFFYFSVSIFMSWISIVF